MSGAACQLAVRMDPRDKPEDDRFGCARMSGWGYPAFSPLTPPPATGVTV
jgi:hypothetical protein